MRLMNTTTTVPYVLLRDRDKDGNPNPDATTFHLRCLTESERGTIQDTMIDLSSMLVKPSEGEDAPSVSGMRINPSLTVANRVRLGVVGWDNLTDHEGNVIPYTTTKMTLGGRSGMNAVPLEIYDALPPGAAQELDREISRLSTFTAEEGN